MADTTGIISSKIVIDATQAKQEFQTLSQQMKELKVAHEKSMSPSNNGSAMFQGAMQSTKDLQGQIVELTGALQRLRTMQNTGTSKDTFIDSQTKAMEQQAIATQKSTEAIRKWNQELQNAKVAQASKAETEWAQMKASYKPDRSVVDPNNIAQLREQFALRQSISEATERTNVKAIADAEKLALANSKVNSAGLQEQMKPQSFQGYAQQVKAAQTHVESMHQAMVKLDTEQNRVNFAKAKDGLQAADAAMQKFSADMGIGAEKASYLGSFMQKFRSHFNWMLSGMVLNAFISIPSEYIKTLSEIEVGMAGIAQVLPDVHGNQTALNQVSREFVGIAQQYGEAVSGVIEAGKLWGRAYKDIPTLMAFTSASAKLAIADNFGLAESNKALEATLAQYEWRAKTAAEATAYSMRVVDTWTNVAHNAQISAQDLAQANERTAGVARMVGVEFEFLQALVAAGVRNTGRSGAEIGNTLKTVFGSIHSDKAVGEIEAIGVAMKTTADDGTQKWRKVQDVLVDLAIATRATTKDVEGLFKASAGGKFQWAKFSSMMDYDELIKVYGLAVNSAGVTEKQIGMQMDTISRKSKQLMATIDGLVTNSGGGISSAIKALIGEATNFINVLNNIPASTVNTVSSLAHATIAIYAMVRGYKAIIALTAIYSGSLAANTASETLSSGAKISNAMAQGAKTAATGINTMAVNVNTMSLRANAMATTVSTGGLNLLIAALIAGALAMDGYSMATGGAMSSLDDLGKSQDSLNKMEEEVGIKENLVQSLKQRYDYVDTLTNAHAKLTSALADESVGSREYNKIQKSLGATQEELAKIVGVSTNDIVQDGELRMDLINQEKDNMENKGSDIRTEIGNLRKAQVAFTNTAIEQSQARINALQNETESWGWLSRAQQWAMDQYAGILDIKIKAQDTIASVLPAGFVDNRAQDIVKAERERVRNWKPPDVTNEINAASAKIAELKLKQATTALANIDYDTTNRGATTKDKEEKPNHTKVEPTTPTDNTEPTQNKQSLLALKQRDEAITLALKEANNDYAIALDKVSTEENIHGTSIETTNAKRQAQLDLVTKLNSQNILAANTASMAEQENNLRWKLGQSGLLGNDFASLNANEQKYQLGYNTNLKGNEDYDAWTKVTQSLSDSKGSPQDSLVQLENDLRWQLSQQKDTKDAKGTQIFNGEYDKLGVKGQHKVLRNNSEALKEDKAISDIYSMWIKVNEALSSNNKEISKYNAEMSKVAVAGYDSPSQVNQRKSEDLDRQQKLGNAGKPKDAEAKYQDELKYAQLHREVEQSNLDNTTAEYEKAKLAWKETLDSNNAEDRERARVAMDILQTQKDKEVLIIAESDKKIKALSDDKFKTLKDDLYDFTESLLIEGNKWNDVVKGLIKTMAQEALKSIVSGKPVEGNGLLSQLMGLIPTGKSAAKASVGNAGISTATMAKAATSNSIIDWFKLVPNADGGVYDKPTPALIGETGDKEAVINLGKLQKGDARQQGLLRYANAHSGTQVTASVKASTVAKAESMSQASSVSREHISELQKSNAIQSKQLQVMSFIAQQNANGGKGQTMQPIVMQQAQSDEQMYAQLQRIQSMYP